MSSVTEAILAEECYVRHHRDGNKVHKIKIYVAKAAIKLHLTVSILHTKMHKMKTTNILKISYAIAKLKHL